jgi:hypothetical protein
MPIATPPKVTAARLDRPPDSQGDLSGFRAWCPRLPVDDPGELFERFWRSEGGRERGVAGAGLGLSIVAAIVAAHGGTVAAANAPGGGAAFTVDLPRAPR